MGKNKKKKNFAGLLGHFGSSNKDFNEKSIIANKLVDEYNRTVWTLPVDDQMEYQIDMKEKMYKILGYC